MYSFSKSSSNWSKTKTEAVPKKPGDTGEARGRRDAKGRRKREEKGEKDEQMGVNCKRRELKGAAGLCRTLAGVQTISRVVTDPSKSAAKAKRPEGHRGPRASVFLGSLFRSGTTSWRGGGPHCRTSSRRLSFASKGREKQHRQRRRSL